MCLSLSHVVVSDLLLVQWLGVSEVMYSGLLVDILAEFHTPCSVGTLPVVGRALVGTGGGLETLLTLARLVVTFGNALV